MNLKKSGRYLRANLLGPGPRRLKKIIYRSAVSRRLRNTALEDIENATNQSKQVKCELKKTIMESVSTLSNIFHVLKKGIVDKSAQNIELQTEVNEVKRELQAYRHTSATIQVAPTIDRS